MKKLGLVFILAVFSFAKILVVNSYSSKDQCGIPQLQGFLSVMYSYGYKPNDFKIIFLNARINNKKTILKKIKPFLNKKYDFVVTFDDAAFKYAGIPFAKRGIWVYFSGMNYPYKFYERKFNLPKNIEGVYEKLYIKKSLQIFNKVDPIKKIACFYSNGIGKILKLQTQNELKNSIFANKIDYFYIKDIKDLEQKTKEVNNNKNYTLFLPFALSLKEDGKKVSFLKFKDIYLKNIKKPDISINMFFVKLGFLGFGGVDFYKMGEQLANLIINSPKTHVVENAKYHYFFINVKRAKEINFKLPKWFIKNYVRVLVNG